MQAAARQASVDVAVSEIPVSWNVSSPPSDTTSGGAVVDGDVQSAQEAVSEVAS